MIQISDFYGFYINNSNTFKNIFYFSCAINTVKIIFFRLRKSLDIVYKSVFFGNGYVNGIPHINHIYIFRRNIIILCNKFS